MTEVQRIAIEVYENLKEQDAEDKRHREAKQLLQKELTMIRNKCQHKLEGSLGDPAGGPSQRFCEICGKNMP